MYALSMLTAFYALITITFSSILIPRVLDDPVAEYLEHMCLPLYSNVSRTAYLNISLGDLIPSLAFSPFPCEQSLYLQTICMTNGTREIDFLAEQECLCNGSYFYVSAGCDDCYFAHGYSSISPSSASSRHASLSTAECSPSPPYQPFGNLVGRVNITSIELAPSESLGTDRFPNITAVSNYFTETGAVTPGAITGSATARQTIFTNTRDVVYTPTTTAAGFGSSSSSATASAATTSSTGNAAVRGGMHIFGGILAAGVGAIALL